MSRVGRKVIPIPKDVKIQIGAESLQIQGPKGKLTTPVPPGISFKLEDGELAASRQLGTINYAVEGSGPDHARTFEAILRIGGNDYGAGSGNSKKEAEQEAAADAWRRLSAPSTVSPETATKEAAAREAAPAESAAPDAQQLQSQTGA